MEEDKDKNATSDMANLRTSKDIKRWMVVEIGEGRENWGIVIMPAAK